MSKKILIIDDEQDMQIYLRTLFTKAGYTTEQATNGREGLEKTKTFQPDLITLDIMMPKRSGLNAYYDLRSSPATKEIPVIVLTGMNKPEELFGDAENSLPQPEAIVEKPIERESFLKTVQAILEGADEQE